MGVTDRDGGADLVAGVDIGGTKILCGVVDSTGEVVTRVKVPTPRLTDPDALTDAIADAVRLAQAETPVARVGVGVAAYVDSTRSRAMFAPHLAYRDYPLRAELEARVGVPVTIENDANAAIWAEVAFGVAQGAQQVIGVTVGTGIGGAMVVDGRLRRGAAGMAGEFGHLRVVPEGRRCSCGLLGCWEEYASGGALTRAASRLVAEQGTGAGMIHDLAEGDPSAIVGPMVTEAARAGDRAALALFEDLGRWLGAGLASLASIYDPEMVVVGGGLADDHDLFLGAAQDAMEGLVTGNAHRPRIAIHAARLGSEAGFRGAARLACES